MLLPMVDGGIKKIESDTWSEGGCETCDFGSAYANEYVIHLTRGKLEIKVTNMYHYALSDGLMMETVIANIDEIKSMNEQVFCEWIEKKLRSQKNEYGDAPDSLEFKYIETKEE